MRGAIDMGIHEQCERALAEAERQRDEANDWAGHQERVNWRLERRVAELEAASPVLAEVGAEREKQDAKWGEQNHIPIVWLSILMEEVGEAAQAALPLARGGKSDAEYRAEMVQVAAVAVAAIEALDRAALSPQTAAPIGFHMPVSQAEEPTERTELG